MLDLERQSLLAVDKVYIEEILSKGMHWPLANTPDVILRRLLARIFKVCQWLMVSAWVDGSPRPFLTEHENYVQLH